MALSPFSSPYAAILKAIRDRMVVALGIGPQYIRPVASDSYKVIETEMLFAYIRTYGPSPINATTGTYFENVGAGRFARQVGRRVRIYLYTRWGGDVYGGDESALMGPTLPLLDPKGNPTYNTAQTVETLPGPTLPGQVISEELVLNALDDWMPVNPLIPTQGLLVSPLHWVEVGGPPERKPEDEEGLVRSTLDFQAVYVLSITRDEPPLFTLPIPVVPMNQNMG